MMKQNITSTVAAAIKSDALLDLAKEYGEISIDATLDEGLVKEFPVVSSLFSLVKVGVNIRDRLFVNKLIKFLANLSSLDASERQKMIARLEGDENYGRKVSEHLIEIIDRIDSHHKPKIIAHAFKAYAEEKIDVIVLNRIIVAIEQLPSFELKNVRSFKEASCEERAKYENVTMQYLANSGFAIPVSAYDGMAYLPSDLCNTFIDLSLDK